MKRIVRSTEKWQGVLIGFGSLLLIGIVQQETAVSYLVVAGVAALLIRDDWNHRRKGKSQDLTS
jgi:hypothetical protein